MMSLIEIDWNVPVVSKVVARHGASLVAMLLAQFSDIRLEDSIVLHDPECHLNCWVTRRSRWDNDRVVEFQRSHYYSDVVGDPRFTLAEAVRDLGYYVEQNRLERRRPRRS